MSAVRRGRIVAGVMSTILTASAALYPQNPLASPSGDSIRIRWEKGMPGTDYYYEEDFFVKVITMNGVAVEATRFSDVEGRICVGISVKNGRLNRIDVLPALFTLDVISPKVRSLKKESPEDLIHSIRRVGWAERLSRLGDEGQEKATVSTPGEVDTTITYSDPEKRRLYFERARQLKENRNARVALIHDISLKATTIALNEEAMGAVFFERDKKAQLLLLRVPVSNVVFEFPIEVRPN